MKKFSLLISITLLVPFTVLFADEEVEEVVVTGSQIKGAKITGVLPVTVLSSEDIEAIGPEDGTELLENIAEQGVNYFTEAESCLLYTSPSPRDKRQSRMPSSA